jgi:hypothetical protein
MYERPRQTSERDAIGTAIAQAMKNRTVEVWPENWPAFTLFCDIGGQWRMGFGGPVALDYLVLHRELDDLGLTGEERQRMKADIRVMEQAALEAIHQTDTP